MSEENGCEVMETIDEIVREMRIIGGIEEKSTDQIPNSFQSPGLRMFADRIEAAAKREREAGAESAQVCGEIGDMVGREAACHQPVTDCHGFGNSAAMREALESVRNWCLNRLVNSSHQVTVEGLLSVVNAALSAPSRNCDVGTAEEQVERHKRLCESMSHITKDCWVVGCSKCIAVWAQMPYEEVEK